ncbi:MAG: hypothetical protein ACUVR0_00195 [Candidatus Aminicenantales bacterium]
MRQKFKSILVVCLSIIIAATGSLFVNGAAKEARILDWQTGTTAEERLVPLAVRVYDSGEFVTDLSLDDFEVKVGNELQKPVALVLVNKQTAERQEGTPPAALNLSRRIIILMQMIDFHPQLAQTIQDLFETELIAGDILELQTPMKSYRLNPKALEMAPKPELVRNTLELVRKDILQGNMLYNSLLNELKRFVRRIGGVNPMAAEELDGVSEDLGLPFLFQSYRTNMQKLEALRRVDERRFTQFAETLATQPGQKFVFFLYQREFLPEISPMKMNELMTMYQDEPNIIGDLQELFHQFHRETSFNLPAIEASYAAANAQVNFLFLNKDAPKIAGLVMRERSEDVFKMMSKVAQATGGIIDASQNPEASLRKAFSQAEKYYLLFLEPQPEQWKRGFNSVAVKIRRPNLTVLTRTGFSAGAFF